MSLRAPSLLDLLVQLQQRGLTHAILHALLTACDCKEPGRFLLHLGAEGKIVGCESRQKTLHGDAEKEHLTKV